jgi:ABC-2 type transport system ATP-binding protein/lipopolysaccharide transport system ATP-binding protein
MSSVSVQHIDVSFPIYEGAQRSLRHVLMASSTGGRIASDSRHRIVVEALKDVSFEVARGDRLAILGHNGAGKTTLLRVLAGIYEPLRGQVSTTGRVVPLFDISLGMDLDATGYENIRIRGLYLGMTEAEIARQTPEIAEFTELGEFLHLPARTYSLGMRTRLAFGVSTSITPDILLLDEGIGAVDANFVEKADARLKALIERSGVMVLASHSMSLLRRFCNKALVLEHGAVSFVGSINEAISAYARRSDLAGQSD